MDGELKDEVRLLKRWLKGVGIYGAEAAVEGISGYLAELIVLHCGGFCAVVETVAGWKSGVHIVIENELPKKWDAPLVVIDPTDPSRNVAAALSLENFNTFIAAAKDYLTEPRETFFFPNPEKELSQEEILGQMKERWTGWLALVFDIMETIDDILHPQLRKAARTLAELCEREGFKIIKTGYYAGEVCSVILEAESFKLSGPKRHEGPPVNNPRGLDFLEKWEGNPRAMSNVYEENGKLMVDIEHRYADLKTLVTGELGKLNLGKGLTPIILKTHKILVNEELALLQSEMSKFLDTRRPWER
jgi:tRNA nucleotidyltransferase (CCA-adding enzyme)